MTLNTRIKQLEEQVATLIAKINDLSANSDQKSLNPYSVVGGSPTKGSIHPVDPSSGAGFILGGSIIWNDSELALPPINVEPPLPSKGYNKHSHSRFSGGALIFDKLEIVEYDWGSIVNKESQQFWNPQPEIKKDKDSNGVSVDKIGLLDLTFNPDTKKWSTAAHEIDVKTCYLVMRDKDGNIMLDANGKEMKSLLYNSDSKKTSVVWDSNAEVWRFLAVYASGE